MKRMTVITGAALCLLTVLMTAGISEAQSGNVKSSSVKSSSSAAVKVDNNAPGRGQSMVVVENTLSAPIRVFINGRAAGTVKARGTETITVADGNNNITVQSTARSGGTSREVRFNALSELISFKATSPNATSVSLTRVSAQKLSAVKPATKGKGVAVAPASEPPRQGRAVVGSQQRQGKGVGVSGYDDDYEDEGEAVEIAAAPVPAPAPPAPAAAPAPAPVPAAKPAPAPAPAPTPAPATAAAPAPAAPDAETLLRRDKDAMFERLDAAVGATAPAAAAPAPAPAAQPRTVTIGGKTWTAENLNVKTDGSSCYDNKDANCAKYGRLYSLNAAMSACKGLGAGWHLPSNEEWQKLADFAGGSSAAGKKLKSKSGWSSGNGTDDYSFSALPGGYGSGSNFSRAGEAGGWWSAAGSNADNAQYRYMEHDNMGVNVDYAEKAFLLSVRCARD